MNEIAFTVMDLEYRGRPACAYRFLNAYLEASGDYSGIAMLRFYVVYRAMVRAKVACLRSAQLAPGDIRPALPRDYDAHVELANAYATVTRSAVIVTHGFAGCGKTTLSQILLERIGAIRIRTDVERKRLHGLDGHESSQSGIDRALYAPEVTRTTYHHVSALARMIVASGFPVLVDGTFLQRWQRDMFRSLAADASVPFVIVDISANEATLYERVRQRTSVGRDASEAGSAVLEHQLRTHEPLGSDEHGDVVTYDGELPLSKARAPDAWRGVMSRLGIAAFGS